MATSSSGGDSAPPAGERTQGSQGNALTAQSLSLKAQGLPPRGLLLAAAAGAAALVVLALGLVIDGRSGAFWFGRGSPVFAFPFSIQALMHILFALGLAELFVRLRVARWEAAFLDQQLLPEDEETVLQVKDLGAIRRRVSALFDGDSGFLPSLVDLAILRLQTSHSVDQAANVMNASLELFGQRVELRYQMVRYLVWVIPTIGFIGTVVGIAAALAFVDPDRMDLRTVTASLSVAFDTTVIALLWSAILVLAQHVAQKKEEMALNQAGHYCLTNLINRIYIEPQTGGR